MSEKRCPFCYPDAQRIFHSGRLVLGLWDAFPVNPGHALLVPKRHVATWFDATEDEKAELLSAVDIVRKEILAQHEPDGFNIGIKVGEAAGQTVFHGHLHVELEQALLRCEFAAGIRVRTQLADQYGKAAIPSDTSFLDKLGRDFWEEARDLRERNHLRFFPWRRILSVPQSDRIVLDKAR